MRNRLLHVYRTVAVLLAAVAPLFLLVPARAAGAVVAVKLLFCAYGSVGLEPVPKPAGFEDQFAVAVIEVNSTAETIAASKPSIELIGSAGNTVRTKRVISVETFDEPYVSGEGNFAYYLNTATQSRSRAWDGTLPGGMIHLRVRVALDADKLPDAIPGRCRVRLGNATVEGPIDGIWPT